MRIICGLLAGLALHFAIAAAPERHVAITIDDLPRGGDGGARTLPAVRAMTSEADGAVPRRTDSRRRVRE